MFTATMGHIALCSSCISPAHRSLLQISKSKRPRIKARPRRCYHSMQAMPALPESRKEVEEERAFWSRYQLLDVTAIMAAAKLNEEQYKAYHEILGAVEHNRPLCAYIDGRAGRGKTFLVNTICNKLRSEGHIVLPTATSAFAAQLYPGGRTTHSMFKVPVVDHNVLTLDSPIEPDDDRGELISQAAVIIWDEAPMAHRAVLDCVEETCRRVMRNDQPFGGKVVILLGDFRQTCPVVPYGGRQAAIKASIKSSHLWPEFTIYPLTQPIRNAEDPEFAESVDSIGDGAGPMVSLDMLDKVHEWEELIDFVYPEAALGDPTLCLKRAILAPTNEQVDFYNAEMLGRLKMPPRVFDAIDRVKMTKLDNAMSQRSVFDYVKRYPPLGLLPAALTVKVNAVYRVLCNYAPARGLVHNARVIVQSIATGHVTVRVLQGLGGTSMVKAEDIQLPRTRLSYKLPTGHTLVRQQFPLAPAYATTFNSCQGLTLDRIGVDLTRQVFCHGQLYTMLSRIRHRSHAMVRMMKNETATRNMTYSELLA